MDRRRLKKVPSLLGRVDSGMSHSDDNQNDKVISDKRPTLRSSKVRSQTPESSPRNSSNGTSIKLKSTSREKRTSTPVTPDKETSSDESDGNEIFITKRRGANKSLDSSRNSTQQSETVKSKRKRHGSSSSETDFPQSPKHKKRISDKEKSQAPRSQEKLSATIQKSSSKLSRNSSITHYSSDENTDKGDEEENDENWRKSKTKRVSGGSNKSPNIDSSIKKNKKRARSSSSNERNSIATESTDDDMFDELVPAKSTPIVALNSKRKPIASSPLKASRNRSGSESHELTKSPQHSRVTRKNRSGSGSSVLKNISQHSKVMRSQSAKKSPPMRKTNNHFNTFLKEAGIILAEDGPNSFCKKTSSILIEKFQNKDKFYWLDKFYITKSLTEKKRWMIHTFKYLCL